MPDSSWNTLCIRNKKQLKLAINLGYNTDQNQIDSISYNIKT
jgi:hypothetical protein